MSAYSWFVNSVVDKQTRDKKSLEQSIDETLNEMPDDFEIKQFLLDNKAEVKRTRVTEYEEGREEGKIETMKATVKKLFKKGQTVEEIAELLEIASVDVEIWLDEQ
ncbi:MAG: hypothetical protein IKX88_14645 [Thermoguttaceae bacterium]|nr:hypothetical protein [Thermoguttaceae bacterium]